MGQKGFSLVELMVVVAIILILSAIGIPQYRQFIATAKQVEAKTNLSTIHTLNSAYFITNQQTSYTDSFSAMGYDPVGEFNYNIGFATDNTATVCSQPNAKCKINPGVGGLPAPNIDSWAEVPGTNKTTFKAQAQSYIYQSERSDVWVVDQNKQIINCQNGISSDDSKDVKTSPCQ